MRVKPKDIINGKSQNDRKVRLDNVGLAMDSLAQNWTLTMQSKSQSKNDHNIIEGDDNTASTERPDVY